MNSLSKRSLLTGSIFLLLAVLLGAMGSHVIKAHLGTGPTNSFIIGVQYQFYHGIGLLIIGILNHLFSSKWFARAYWFLLLGVILFSGSLYILALKPLFSNWFISLVGPLTPIGGLCFLIGWILTILGVKQKC